MLTDHGILGVGEDSAPAPVSWTTLWAQSETPLNTPRRVRIAAQSAERDNRTLDSPQHRRAPHGVHSPEHVALIDLRIPQHAPDPAPGNDPFLAAPAPAPASAPAPAPAPALAPAPAPAQQLAAIPPVSALNNLELPLHAPHPAPAPVVYNGQQYNHLPAALAQQLAALPPIPVQIGRGQGHGRGHGHQVHPHPNVVHPPPAQHNAPAPAAMYPNLPAHLQVAYQALAPPHPNLFHNLPAYQGKEEHVDSDPPPEEPPLPAPAPGMTLPQPVPPPPVPFAPNPLPMPPPAAVAQIPEA
ncbi:uncharacterized protein LACBIDRAFT_325789 [Laccaria bicolor S238N-H82]|uniref:Predicted protein n=1 Tax=Laccaria bicolor (strain S238N-H82 / ATCC MYA-4686) TaxID=486041 RepID=B0D680_LACBS|nr:uncharacterized protein LACBIDRAFT_325789 [Laccaria bicolor S238N-H82]EDR10154.1 predicted protein [Laccaria bicolor S238N-H82]|eukprot:XP_001879539.1 predicted protein [Laccaria bicolor S238N-H82]